MKTLLLIVFGIGVFLWLARIQERDGQGNAWHLGKGASSRSSSVTNQGNKKSPSKKQKKKKKPKKNLPEASVSSRKISSEKSATGTPQKNYSEITTAKKISKTTSQADSKKKSADAGSGRGSSIPDSSKYR